MEERKRAGVTPGGKPMSNNSFHYWRLARSAFDDDQVDLGRVETGDKLVDGGMPSS